MSGAKLSPPVIAADLYDAAKGYGFEPGAMRDEVASWIADRLCKDSTRINSQQHFHFRVKPGRYPLSVLAKPVGAAVTLTLRCGAQQVALPLPKAADKTQEPVQRTVTFTAEDVVLASDGYVNLQALQLIAEEEPR